MSKTLGCENLVTSFRLYTQAVASVLRYLITLDYTDATFHCNYDCLMIPNKDETRSQSVARTAIDGRVFSLVLNIKSNVLYNVLCIYFVNILNAVYLLYFLIA